MSNALYKVQSAVLADQIRREANGKAIIIGVYTGDIVVEQFPVNLSLAIWLEVEFPTEKTLSQFAMELRIRCLAIDAAAEEQFEKVMPLNLVPPANKIGENSGGLPLRAILNINNFPARVSEPGRIEVSIRETGKRWKKVIEKRVLTRDSS
jgi:hypothetical protein